MTSRLPSRRGRPREEPDGWWLHRPARSASSGRRLRRRLPRNARFHSDSIADAGAPRGGISRQMSEGRGADRRFSAIPEPMVVWLHPWRPDGGARSRACHWLTPTLQRRCGLVAQSPERSDECAGSRDLDHSGVQALPQGELAEHPASQPLGIGGDYQLLLRVTRPGGPIVLSSPISIELECGSRREGPRACPCRALEGDVGLHHEPSHADHPDR